MVNKGDLRHKLRNRCGIEHDWDRRERKLKRSELQELADYLGVEHDSGMKNDEIRAAIVSGTRVGSIHTTDEDFGGSGLRQIHLTRLLELTDKSG